MSCVNCNNNDRDNKLPDTADRQTVQTELRQRRRFQTSIYFHCAGTLYWRQPTRSHGLTCSTHLAACNDGEPLLEALGWFPCDCCWLHNVLLSQPAVLASAKAGGSRRQNNVCTRAVEGARRDSVEVGAVMRCGAKSSAAAADQLPGPQVAEQIGLVAELQQHSPAVRVVPRAEHAQQLRAQPAALLWTGSGYDLPVEQGQRQPRAESGRKSSFSITFIGSLTAHSASMPCTIGFGRVIFGGEAAASAERTTGCRRRW